MPARPKKQTSVAGIDMNKQGRVTLGADLGTYLLGVPK